MPDVPLTKEVTVKDHSYNIHGNEYFYKNNIHCYSVKEEYWSYPEDCLISTINDKLNRIL